MLASSRTVLQGQCCREPHTRSIDLREVQISEERHLDAVETLWHEVWTSEVAVRRRGEFGMAETATPAPGDLAGGSWVLCGQLGIGGVMYT